MIHNTDPFAASESARSPVRRFRGRLAQTVTLWTSGLAGLTVSSILVSDGEPGRIAGLLDDESELWAAISGTQKFAVSILSKGDQQLADRFAGVLPAPGGLFKQGDPWVETAFGPVIGGTWAGCRLDSADAFGWGLLVKATIEQIELAEPVAPLVHRRGSYRQLEDR